MINNRFVNFIAAFMLVFLISGIHADSSTEVKNYMYDHNQRLVIFAGCFWRQKLVQVGEVFKISAMDHELKIKSFDKAIL